ncbi:MAG: serine hydrolase [Acidobacteria bacterium]|nr:serine hydrolase [Acidobacteriota bacterium]
MQRSVWLLLALGLTSGMGWAQPAAVLPPERAARIDRLLQQYVDKEQIAGAVALVLRDGKPVYEKAVGWSDKEAGRKMTSGTLFRIASQSKAVTSAAIMALVEDGKVGINEPVGNFIASFKKTMVAEKDDNGGARMVAARRPITIAQLLTHTAGISYGREPHLAPLYEAKGLGPAAGNGWYTADKEEPICETMERLGTLPFVAQPGEAYVYGYNTDILGCVVEKASGMPLDEFVRSRITGPLGMKDTRFFVPAAEKDRLAVVYATGAEGKAVRAAEGSRGQGHYVDGPRKSFSGGAGLTSTARDYARFLEAIRRGGALDGARILGPRAVGLMTTNQSGTLHSTTGLGFGYGFQTIDRYGASGLAAVGAFGWSGAYGTTYQVDPKSRMVVVLMIQQMPNGTDIQAKYLASVYQALVD